LLVLLRTLGRDQQRHARAGLPATSCHAAQPAETALSNRTTGGGIDAGLTPCDVYIIVLYIAYERYTLPVKRNAEGDKRHVAVLNKEKRRDENNVIRPVSNDCLCFKQH
jgi:hypothetical protein